MTGGYIARDEAHVPGNRATAEWKGEGVAREEVTSPLQDAAAGKKMIRLEVGGRDITAEIDLASDASATKSARGPAGKGFDKSLGLSASDLEVLCTELLAGALPAGKGVP